MRWPIRCNRPEDSTAVVSPSGVGWTVAEFLGRVGGLAAALRGEFPEIPGRDGIAFAFGDDRAAFAAGLFATWAVGGVAMLPADSRRELVAPLLADAAHRGFLHDTGVGRPIDARPLCVGDVATVEIEGVAAPERGSDAAVLVAVGAIAVESAHGHAGDPLVAAPELAVQRWTAAGLEAEVQAIVARFGFGPDTRVATTLAPSSIGATLVGLLAPWMAGGAFAADRAVVGAGLRDHLAAVAADVLVVASRDLFDLAVAPPGELATVRRVVVAHGALDATVARAVASRHGVAVDACYGPVPSCRESETEQALLRAALDIEGVADAAVAEHGAGDGHLVVVAGDAGAAERVGARLADVAGPAVAVRAMHRIPRDSNRGVTRAVVHRTFGLEPDGAPFELGFEQGEGVTTEDDGACVVTVQVPARSAYYNGHFPGFPVLAGAVQLGALVLPAFARIEPGHGAVRGFQALKFQSRIVPGDVLALRFRVDAAAGKASFEIRRGDETCSSGRLTFDAGAPA